jgi:hypothetical protein
MYITVFAGVRQWFQTWARRIHSTPLQPISLIIILIFSSHLLLGLPRDLFPSGFHIKILYTFLTVICAQQTPSGLEDTCVVYWYSWKTAFRTLPIVTTIRVSGSVRESKVRERLAVSKRTTQTLNMETFDLKKLSQTKGKELYRFKMTMNLRIPQNVGKILSRWATGGFSWSFQLHGVRWYKKRICCTVKEFLIERIDRIL